MFSRMTDPATRLANALADRYRIERPLGAGGMATVYLASDLKHDRKVAIKVLKPELAAVLGADRFVQEIRTTAQLQHPHILPLFDSGEADGFLYYVMPYIQGETIREKLNRETQFGIEEAVRLATQVADALDYAHRHGVIHRDIKPENILLHDGRAMVMDFGIALAVSAAAGGRMTETGLSLGTPHYMSPEQATADKAITARSDVYSLASVLYEMLAGEPPHTGSSAQQIIMKIIAESVQPVTSLRKSVPGPISDALDVALEKLPADRFESAKQFADALASTTFARARGGRSVASSRMASGEFGRTLRHPLTIALTVVAIAAVAYALRGASRNATGAATTAVRFVVNPPSGARLTLSNGGGPILNISPDGSTLVFAADDARGVRRLYLRRVDDLTIQPLPQTESPSAPFFSPDGKTVGFWAAGRIQTVAIAGGAPQIVTESEPIEGATWTTSGDIVLAHAGYATLQRVPASGGRAVAAGALDSANGETAQLYPKALADGTHILYASWGSGGLESVRIGVLDLATGRSHRLSVNGTTALGVVDGRLIYADQSGAVLAVPFDVNSATASGTPTPLGISVATSTRGSGIAVLSWSGALSYQDRNQESMLLRVEDSRVTPIVPDARVYTFPRYSPDGKQIAITIASGTSSDIWVIDVATGALTRLTSGGAVNERPEWSPDGSRILFRTVRGPRSSIWWQPLNATEPASPLVSYTNRDVFEAVMTPDGESVVYQVDTAGADVVIRDIAEPAVPRPLANTRAAEDQARVSPDGMWVAYVSEETGTPQVMVRSISSTGAPAKVQVSITGGNQPVWSRDSKRLFYRGDGKIKVAEILAQPALHVTTRTDVIDDNYLPTPAPHANYDVTPDGKGLLVLKGAAEQLVVVHGWAEELRKRDGKR